MNKNILGLSGCQALFISASSIMITTSAIIGASLTGKAQYATLGVGMTYLAMMIFSYPMSIIMGRIGRRGGFILGISAALLGSLMISYAIMQKSFALYCFSAFILGIGMSCGQYLRFAAIEVAGLMYKGKAISYVLAGGIVAAILGPNLARASREWLDVEFVGTYLCSAMLFLMILVILLLVRFPRQPGSDLTGPVTPVLVIFRRPAFLVAALAALVAYGSMNLVMTATPLSMQHHGHPFSDAALVIQWHILGMFIPSLFTGRLIQHLGLVPMMITGAVILIGCTLANLAGTSYAHYLLGLVLLGVGWNFLYIGGTQLLTRAYAEHEKARAQGMNDFMVAATVATTSMSSGWVLSWLGWEIMNVLVMVAVIVVLVCLCVFYISPTSRHSYAE